MQLEFLPNEILMDIFQYLDARDLFRAFYHLNSRFNALLRSLNNLFITFSTSNSNQTDDSHIFSPYIHTIILNHQANINLKNFPNVRRLKFFHPTCKQLDELDSVNLPYLEHLSIGYVYNCSYYLHEYGEHNHCENVFSNDFPSLISCYLFHPQAMYTLSHTTQLMQLRILRVRSINLIRYQAILFTCPNLYFFRFKFTYREGKPVIMTLHLNLKRMVVDFYEVARQLSDHDIGDYLSCVPNLEQLYVYREYGDGDITPYLNYNWLARSIEHHSPSLRRFKYVYHIYLADELTKSVIENICNRLEQGFKHVHNNRYQSHLVIKLYSCSIFD